MYALHGILIFISNDLWNWSWLINNISFYFPAIKQLSELKSVPWGSVEEVKESSKIQVLDVPDDTGQEDLENYFSNKSACGGEKIRGISKIEDIRGCWLIKYKHREGKPNIVFLFLRMNIKWAMSWENLFFAICEQLRRRSDCADQRLCYSLL